MFLTRFRENQPCLKPTQGKSSDFDIILKEFFEQNKGQFRKSSYESYL